MSVPFKKEFHELVIFLKEKLDDDNKISMYFTNLHKINTDKFATLYYSQLKQYKKYIETSDNLFFEQAHLFFFGDILNLALWNSLSIAERSKIWAYIRNLLTFADMIVNKPTLQTIKEHKQVENVEANLVFNEYNVKIDSKALYDDMKKKIIKKFVKTYNSPRGNVENIKKDIAIQMATQLWDLIKFSEKNELTKELFIAKYCNILYPKHIEFNSYMSFRIELDNVSKDVPLNLEVLILEFKLNEDNNVD